MTKKVKQDLIDYYNRCLALDMEPSYKNCKYIVKDNKLVFTGFVDTKLVEIELNKKHKIRIPSYFEVCDLNIDISNLDLIGKFFTIELGSSFKIIEQFFVLTKCDISLEIKANSVLEICDCAFIYNCSLFSFISENVLSVGISAFAMSENLQMIYLPNCKEIKKEAFDSCSNLCGVDLSSCKSIEENSFIKCFKLINIKLNPQAKVYDSIIKEILHL